MTALPPFSIDDAEGLILSTIAGTNAYEMVMLDAAAGRCTAAAVFATAAQPRFDAAAMDGWAICAGTGAAYYIVGESRAGWGFADRLAPGQAVRISTGAPMPAGATALVRRERGRIAGQMLQVEDCRSGRDIRSQGCDFHAGALLVPAGKRLDPFDLARMAASGIDRLAVWQRPQVAILATGDEITPVGVAPDAFGNHDALSPALQARLTQLGAQATHLGIARDDDGDIADRIAASDAALFLVVGGASGGRHDRVRAALSDTGLSVLVPHVGMRPGKPFWFGRLARKRFLFGLPGNPVAALVALELFVVPALRALQGLPAQPDWIDVAMPDLPVVAGHEHVRFAHMGWSRQGVLQVEPLGQSDSAALRPLLGANALLRQRLQGQAQLLPIHA